MFLLVGNVPSPSWWQATISTHRILNIVIYGITITIATITQHRHGIVIIVIIQIKRAFLLIMTTIYLIRLLSPLPLYWSQTHLSIFCFLIPLRLLHLSISIERSLRGDDKMVLGAGCKLLNVTKSNAEQNNGANFQNYLPHSNNYELLHVKLMVKCKRQQDGLKGYGQNFKLWNCYMYN